VAWCRDLKVRGTDLQRQREKEVAEANKQQAGEQGVEF
jgi:hypothetical protein